MTREAIGGVRFDGNSAVDVGGTMLNHAYGDGIGSPLLRNVTFNGNKAHKLGGAIHSDGSSGGDGIERPSGSLCDVSAVEFTARRFADSFQTP